MEIVIYSFRKNTDPHIAALESHYLKCIPKSLKINLIDIRRSYPTHPNPTQILSEERDLILKRINIDNSYLVTLHEKGKPFTSANFASWLKKIPSNFHQIIFIIGGPWGLHPDIINKSRAQLSLSPMTLTHELARLLLLEQLFRSTQIWLNSPYHK